MDNIRQYIKTLAYWGMGVIGLLIINSILFTHSQILSDGSFVVHAHPYNKSSNPPENHNHHDNDLQIINSITLLFFISLFSFSLKSCIVDFKKYDPTSKDYFEIIVFQKLGRAPPFN